MEMMERWRQQLKQKEAERRAVGEAMESLEEWRIKEKAERGESRDLADVDVLVRCIGGKLLQSAGVAAIASTACWWALSRVRGMTPVRKVLLTGVNGATAAFLYMNSAMAGCQEAFLTQPQSAVAARTRSVIRAKLPTHALLAPFTEEEDERIGRGEWSADSAISTAHPTLPLVLPSPPPRPHT